MRSSILALLLTAATAASGGELPVPAGKGWQHARTGTILRSTMLGLPRIGLADSGTGEWDVSVQYGDADRATSLTVFLFRPGGGDAAMWFDRSRTQIEQRSVYGGAIALSPPVAFTPPGSTVASALRQSFTTGKGPYRSTGLTIVSIGEWLVAVRLSSVHLDAAALDETLIEAVAAIGWPRAPGATKTATVTAACATTLPYGKAKQRKPDLMQALLAGSVAMTIADKKASTTDSTAAEPLCRDGAPTIEYAVYRAPDVTSAYVLALGDSGRTVDVYRSFDAPGLPSGYAVTLRELDGSSATFPYFDKLPRPEQVLKAVQAGGATSRTRGDGKNITIDSGLVK